MCNWIWSRIMEFKNRRPPNANIDVESLVNTDRIENKEAKRQKSWINLIFLVIVWYSTAVVAISSSKGFLSVVPAPLTLCLCQFSFSFVITYCAKKKQKTNIVMSPSFQRLIWMISLSYTLGFLFTNYSFSIVNANLAEAIKSAEPITSVLLSYLFLGESSSLGSYLCLFCVCIGVMISSSSEVSFDWMGFIFAFLSNLCFSLRAVLAKLLSQYPDSSIMDEIDLFYYISCYGWLGLLPLTVVMESSFVIHWLSSVSLPQLYHLLYLLFLNGLMYSSYNLASYYVLYRTNIFSHALLNVFRRVVVIGVTALVFHVSLSPMNQGGILLALIGALSFLYWKSKEVQ